MKKVLTFLQVIIERAKILIMFSAKAKYLNHKRFDLLRFNIAQCICYIMMGSCKGRGNQYILVGQGSVL